MPVPRSPRSTLPRRVPALTAVLLIAVFVMPSQAAPSPDAPPAVEPGVQAEPTYPGEADLPQERISVAEGTVTNSQGTAVNRSKLYITLGPDNPIWGALYFGEFNWPLDDPSRYVLPCSNGIRCLPDPFYQPDCATDDRATQSNVAYFRNPTYPLRPLEGGGADVGVLATTTVNLVAFGSVPATATLTLTTPRSDGEVRPLVAHIWQRVNTPPGCGPLPAEAPPISALIDGQVEIRLSDLIVDGVDVDLGPECRTERPAQVYLWGETERGGYFPNNGGNLGAYEGLHPGSVVPLDDPFYFGYFDGRDIPASSGIDIPPFAGCGTGGDDLSPLVSAMASGPNNSTRAVQSQVATFDELPLDDLTQCSPFGGCPLPAPAAPERPPLPENDQ